MWHIPGGLAATPQNGAMLQPDAKLNAKKEKERKSPRPKGGRVNPKARTKWTDELVTDTEIPKV